MEKLEDIRYEKSKAEDEAFWLKCIVDADIAPTYQAAENIWDSDYLVEDTEENRVFWSMVVELYNRNTEEYRGYLEQRELDSMVFEDGSEHITENPELIDENIHHCFACKKELVPVFLDLHEKGSVQYDNALIVNMAGGYGMFVDPLPQEWLFEEDRLDTSEWVQKGRLDECTAIICHDCAHDLCEKVPWINSIIEPELSHACSADQS